jgi:hypothetical protein
MHVSSQEPPVVRSFAHKLYLAVASLILIGIVSEGLLIGPSLFADTTWGRKAHAILGAVIFLLTLLLPLVGRLSRLSGRMILLSAVLFVLALIQVASADLGRRVSLLAALHPANAMLMVGLTVVLLIQGWQLMRESRGEMKPSLGKPPRNVAERTRSAIMNTAPFAHTETTGANPHR